MVDFFKIERKIMNGEIKLRTFNGSICHNLNCSKNKFGGCIMEKMKINTDTLDCNSFNKNK